MEAPNVLGLGAKGPEVAELQELLRTLGYEVEADGSFGADTERAIRDFQSQHGLAADGIVGSNTSEALGAELNRLMSKAQPESEVEQAVQMKGAVNEPAPIEEQGDSGGGAELAAQFLPRIDSDRIGDTDLLDITPDVHAIASLIASHSLKPPLAIGLFGDWGSGKTFFMNQLRERIDKLADHAKQRRHEHKQTAFHTDIIHIEFNAWHYVEANLWASLVTHIFETLNKHFVEQEDVEKKKWERLLRKLDEALQLRNEAQEGLTQARADLDSAKADQKEQQVKLTQVVAAVWEGLKTTDAKPQLEKIESVLHVEEVKQLRQDIALQEDEAVQLYKRSDLFRRAAFRGLGSAGALVSVAVVLLAVVVVVGVMTLMDVSAELQMVSARVAEVLGLLGGASTWVGSALRTASSTMDAVESVDKSIREKLDRDPKQAAQLREAREAVATAQDAVAEQERRIGELQKQIWELRPSQRLAQFLADRVASTDYRKYLGLPALIRRDFSKLEKLMDQDVSFDVSVTDGNGDVDTTQLPDLIAGELKKVDTPFAEDATVAGRDPSWSIIDNESGRTIKVRREGTNLHCDVEWDLPRIDRIVLYVDDLDRCPPARVVQVLQAVHLLLAFDLFVVVVGVDARWVSQSLKHHYKELWLEADRDGDSTSKPAAAEEAWVVPGYEATPHEYLEKIFQIPFWLQPMSPAGTQTYIHGLLPIDELSETRSPRPRADTVKKGPTGSSTEPVNGKVGKRISVPLMGAVPKDEERFDDETMNPRNLRIERIERDFMDQLAPIVGRSPRAVKRFVNVYRLIRAGISPSDYDAYLGTGERPGDYQIVLLLLAIVIGAPTIAQSVFRYVDEQPKNQSLSDVITKLPSTKTKAPRFKTTKEWYVIQEFIKDFSEREGARVTVAQLQAYQHRVGQYSFRVGRF